MVASQTYYNLIKYGKPKILNIYIGYQERQREIEEIHGWWDNGYITPFELDHYTLGDLSFSDLDDAVASRMNNDYYADFIADNNYYLTTDEYYDYDDFLNYPFNELGTISENEYWNGYYREDPESEDPEDPDYIWQYGTHYYLIKIRNGLWADYGEVHIPW